MKVDSPKETDRLSGLKNRVLQHLARILPGATSLRVLCHKWRGVQMGRGVWIGYDVILETAWPRLISIGNNVTINVRTTIIAHFKTSRSVTIEDDVFIGPNVTILPNVKIGEGSVVTAGSVVTSSVPSNTMVQGNPAQAVAKCGIPLLEETSLKDFTKNLLPLRKGVKAKRAG